MKKLLIGIMILFLVSAAYGQDVTERIRDVADIEYENAAHFTINGFRGDSVAYAFENNGVWEYAIYVRDLPSLSKQELRDLTVACDLLRSCYAWDKETKTKILRYFVPKRFKVEKGSE